METELRWYRAKASLEVPFFVFIRRSYERTQRNALDAENRL